MSLFLGARRCRLSTARAFRKSEHGCVRVGIAGVLPSKRSSLCDEGVLADTRAWPGQFCTITSSNVDAIEVGSRVIYLTARGPAGLDSDVILEPPGPGNNRAFGHCTLIAPVRLCTFSGGTGKFTHFQATATVSLPLGGPGGPNFSWTGTYSFSPHD